MASNLRKKVDVKPTQARDEARTLRAPGKYQKGKPLPGKVGRVFSATRKRVETFYAPNGLRMQSESFVRKTEKLYVRLKQQQLTDDNKMGIKNVVRGIKLPFRTDQNELIDEGFTSEEILAYVVTMKGFDKKFHVDFITDEMLEAEAEQNELVRDEEQEEILLARLNRAEEIDRKFKAGVSDMVDAPEITAL